MSKRPTWIETFLEVCDIVSKRSTCLKRKVGCVIVKHNRIVATGYNGVPSKVTHCISCSRLHCKSGEDYDLCNAIHAEQNAICSAAMNGVKIYKATLYVNHGVCHMCARSIINSGISKVICKGKLSDKTKDLFIQAGINYESEV